MNRNNIDQILVTGGTGTLGQEIVKLLLTEKFNVAVLSSQENPILPFETRILKGNLTDKKSIIDATNNVDIIVHCASDSRNSKVVDIEGTKNLLEIITNSKFQHFIYVSITGVDKSHFPYYQDKYKVEKIIRGSSIQWSILRATQFHDLILHRIIKPLDKGIGSPIKVPKNMRFQSIDKIEVAKRVVELIIEGPTNSTITIGGPEVLAIGEMVQLYLNALGRNEKIESTSNVNELYNLFSSGINLCPEYTFGKITWEQYINSITKNNNNG